MSDINVLVQDGNNVSLVVTPTPAIEVLVDKAVPGPEGPPGEGVPAGGLTGQVLAKVSDTDFDSNWQDPSGGVTSVNGQTGDVTLGYADVGAPATDGTGATGTWDIDITGSASHASTADSAGHASTADSATVAGNVSGIVAVANGGTGADNATTARANLSAAKSGANGDITSMAGLTGGIETPDYITFDTTPETVPTAPGSLFWDSADGNQTLSLVMANGDAVQQIGEEQYYRIKASSAISNGQVVMFSGTVGASGGLTGAPAAGLTASTASYVMGIATQDIANNAWGYVTSFGLVRQLNTAAWPAGTILYYDPTVAGGLTPTIPAAPNAKVQVCAVIYQHALNGSLFVRPSFGGALGQYEGDVQITSPLTGDALVWNSVTGRWENKPVSVSPGGATTQVQFNDGGAFAGDAGLTFDKVNKRLDAKGYGLNSAAILTEATTARTLTAADNGKVIYCTNAAAVTITTAVSLGAGFSCMVVQGGTGQVTIAQGASTTRVGFGALYKSSGQYAALTVVCPVTDTFVVIGGGA